MRTMCFFAILSLLLCAGCTIRQYNPGPGPGPGPGPAPVYGDEVEPNDGIDLADPVSDFDIQGHIAHPGDVDWFVLNAQEGTNPAFAIHHSPGIDIDFGVYSNGAQVGLAIGAQSGDGIRCYVPGRCHIRVWSARGTGPYTIQIFR